MKQKRHQKILQIIAKKDVKTQEQLTEELENAGFAVTQATVSRDIKELGLIKISMAGGAYKYSVSKENTSGSTEHIFNFSKSVISIKYALHTVVVRTYSGMANAVATSIDSFLGHEILGTVAGDDTILIILEDEEHAEKMASKIYKALNWKE